MFLARTILPLLALLLVFADVASAAPVNINTADAVTISRELKGIGTAKATAIVEYRQKHGAFRSVDDLTLVKGIGQKMVDRLRADLRVTGGATSAKPVTTTKPAPSGAARR